MNALFEFLILAGGSFFIAMFLSYKDGMRNSAPKGPLASLLNNLNGWKYEDQHGFRGILFRQPLWIKMLVALLFALVIRFGFDLFFDFKSASGKWQIFTGYTGWLLMAVVIFCGVIMSNLWPNVKNKIVDIKEETLKDEDEMENKEPDHDEEVEVNEEEVSSKDLKEEADSDEGKSPSTDENKNDSPDDIINDYLK